MPGERFDGADATGVGPETLVRGIWPQQRIADPSRVAMAMVSLATNLTVIPPLSVC
jgi:hypothetical protein